jgi:hypothetical protein
MKAVESSLSYRSIRAANAWVGRNARASATARALRRLAEVAGAALGDSRVFGTGRIGFSTLDARSPSLTASTFARLTLAVQSYTAEGEVGRAVRRASAAASTSALAGSAWLRLVGAGLFGLGAGYFLLAGRSPSS